MKLPKNFGKLKGKDIDIVVKHLTNMLSKWNDTKPTKRQKKIFEVLQNFGVVSREYKHHSELVETLDELK